MDVALGPSSPGYLPAPQVQVGDTPVPGTCWLVTRALLWNRMRASGEGNVGTGTAGSLRGLWECGGAARAGGTPEDRQGPRCTQRQQQHSRVWGWSGDNTQLCPGLWSLGGGEEGQAGRSPLAGEHPIPHGAQMRLPGLGHTARGGRSREPGEGLHVCVQLPCLHHPQPRATQLPLIPTPGPSVSQASQSAPLQPGHGAQHLGGRPRGEGRGGCGVQGSGAESRWGQQAVPLQEACKQQEQLRPGQALPYAHAAACGDRGRRWVPEAVGEALMAGP